MIPPIRRLLPEPVEMQEDAPLAPLCTNILRLQLYLLAPDEVILFDWFIIKQISFKYKDFHYSQARIEKETRIKRTRQNVIINHFRKMGFLSTEIRINSVTRGKVTYFRVDFSVLKNHNLLGQIISMDYYEFVDFIKFICFHAAVQKTIQE